MALSLDILAIGAHPDDVELAASGTLLKAVAAGKRVGILDLSRGELGSRGTVETRAAEARKSGELIGLSLRENAGLPDGFISSSKEQLLTVVRYLRQHRPNIVLANAIADRHPDHGNAAALVNQAFFLCGLRTLATTTVEGEKQEAWRPKALYHYIQDQYIKPNFVVDISAHFERRQAVIASFSSQFYMGEPQSEEETTPISTPEFWKFLEARARELGRSIGVEFGEGFNTQRPVGLNQIFDII